MTNRNPKFESNNQSNPKTRHYAEEMGTEITSGDDNKGKTYRSKKGAKSQLKNPQNH